MRVNFELKRNCVEWKFRSWKQLDFAILNLLLILYQHMTLGWFYDLVWPGTVCYQPSMDRLDYKGPSWTATWYVGPSTLQNGLDETVRWTMSWNQKRILLLIRDPRGILNSRKPLMTQLDHDGLVKNVMWTCKHNLKNLNDLRKNDLVSFLDTSRGRNKIFSYYYVTLLRNKLT